MSLLTEQKQTRFGEGNDDLVNVKLSKYSDTSLETHVYVRCYVETLSAKRPAWYSETSPSD